MTVRKKALSGIVAAMMTTGASSSIGAQAGQDDFAPRVVDARISDLSVHRATLSLTLAIRGARDVTVRSLAFTDSFVDDVPAWIAPVEGHWTLRAGQEFVIPQAVEVSVYARDLLPAEDLAGMMISGAVAVRTTVEMAFATPWPGRLILMGPTQTAIADVEVILSLPTAPVATQPLVQLGAAVLDSARQTIAPAIVAGLNSLPGRRAILERFGAIVAPVTTTYTIDQVDSDAVQRTSRTLGFWWSATTFCTTREALEPWRFDAADAVTLQLGGGRLSQGTTVTTIGGGAGRTQIQFDSREVAQRLPRADEQGVHMLVDGVARRIRLADREAASAVACLHVGGAPTVTPQVATAQSAGTMAAFTPGRSLSVVWTDVVEIEEGRVTLTVPLHRASFGSPIVTESGLAGIVVSSTTAQSIAAVAAAVARTVPVM